jgi:hypothetical protein
MLAAVADLAAPQSEFTLSPDTVMVVSAASAGLAAAKVAATSKAGMRTIDVAFGMI